MSSYFSVIFERCLILYYYICSRYWWACEVTWTQVIFHDSYFNCCLGIIIFKTLCTLLFIRHFKCNFRLKLRLLNFLLRLCGSVYLAKALIDHLTRHVLLWATWNLKLIKICPLQETVRCQLTNRVVTTGCKLFLNHSRSTITLTCWWCPIVLSLI
jgi:hypothetical protein